MRSIIDKFLSLVLGIFEKSKDKWQRNAIEKLKKYRERTRSTDIKHPDEL